MEKIDQYSNCVCRTCLNEDEASSYGNNTTLQQQWLTIFDIIEECGALQIAELLSQVVPQMDVQLSDELPKKICGKCLQQLLGAHRFQQMCVRSQEQMRQIFSTKRTDFTTPSMAASKEFACGTNDTDSSALETNHSSKSFHNLRHVSIEERPQQITGQRCDPEAVQSTSLANINTFPEAYKVEEDFFKKFLKNEPNKDGGEAMHSANSTLSVEYAEKQVNVTTDEKIATDTSQSGAVEHLQSIDQSLEHCKDSQDELSQFIKNEPIENDEPSTEYSNADTIHSTISVMKDELLPLETEEGQENVTSPQHLHANNDTSSNSARHLSLKQSIDVPNTEPILKQHACASCDKIFKSAAALKRHVRIHTAQQPECEKSSTSGNSKKRHIRDSEDKPYECPYCPLRFRCKQGVSRHKKIHEDVERELCDICGKNVRKSTLKSHKIMHTDEKPYTCEICEKGFIRIQELRRHMYIHTGEKPYKCEYCERAHASRSTLLHHLMSHLGENVFRCELCPLAFPLASERRLHLLTHKNEDPETREQNMKALREEEAKLRLRISRNETLQSSAENSQQQLEDGNRHSPDKPYECPYCPLRFRCMKAVTKHKQTHEGTIREACDICGKNVRKWDLKRHKLIHTGDKPYKCDECEKRFYRLLDLRDHMRIHTGEKPFKCKYCEHAYTSSGALTQHLRHHLGDNVFRCDFCPLAFRLAAELRLHFTTHKNEDPETREQNMKALKEEETKLMQQISQQQLEDRIKSAEDKPYECPYCPKKFHSSYNMNQHKQIHEGVERQACDICGKNVRKSDLKRHKLIHTGEKKHKCDICEKRFILPQELRYHMRTHTGEKPYKCKYCEHALNTNSALLKHLRMHLGKNVFRCDFCPLAFPLAAELRSHFITHKNEDTETRERNMKALREEEDKLKLQISKNSTQQPSAEATIGD